MRKFLLLFLLLAGCTTNQPYDYRYTDNPSNVRHLQQSVVSIMHLNSITDQLEGPKCTAFYISETLLATAHHCVVPPESENLQITEDLTIQVPIKNDEPIIGRNIPIMTRNNFEEFATSDGEAISYYEAMVVGMDPDHDVAILHIQAGTTFDFMPISSMEPIVGQRVYAMGMPRHQPWILTIGMISSMHPGGTQAGNIMHQANIAPGSSGSPLINDHGQVIGVNIGYVAETNYLGVAIPIHHVQTLVRAYRTTN